MNRLRFKPHYRVERVAPDLVFLISAGERHTLTGALYYHLAPLLITGADTDAIAAALSAIAPAVAISRALTRLTEAGYVTADAPTADTPAVRFWSQTGQPSPTGTIAVSAVDAEAAALLPHAAVLIAGMGLSADDTAAHTAALDLVLAADRLDPALADRARSAARPWLLAQPIGVQAWIGPVFTPGEPGCWACYAARVRTQLPVETFAASALGLAGLPPSPADLPPLRHAALGLAIAEAARWLAGDRTLIRTVYQYDHAARRGTFHRFTPLPACPVCGDPAPRPAQPIALESRPLVSRHDAGYRSAAAAQVLADYGDRVDPVVGIVPYVAPVASPPHIHLYASGPNRARSLTQWAHFRRSLRSQSAGKGTDAVQAQASALCEALERYSGTFHGDEPRLSARLDNLPGAIAPSDLLLFSDRQYAERETWNADCPPHLAVPDPFDPAQPIDWTPVWSLTAERFAYVPTAYCYYDYPIALDHVFCGADSNGCAAGSSREDALLQGFLELIERDAVALWWYNRAQRPAWDLAALAHPYLEQTRAYCAAAGREVWVLDISADFPIPCAVAVSRRCDGPPEDIVLGFGAHLDPAIAVLRAVTELNQSLPAALRDHAGRPQSQSPWEIRWWDTVRTADHPFLVPSAALPSPLISAAPSFDDLAEAVRWCVTQAALRGIEVLALDQTRGDGRLPVVRVIAPGLRHFWGRFAPGRLYDVPVRLGWQAMPTPETDLNPLPMFM